MENGPLTDKEVLRKLKEALISGEEFEGSIINYKKDGTPYFVHWYCIPCLGIDGDPISWLSLQDYKDYEETTSNNG